MLDIDLMLSKCGDFHRYQWLLLGLFCVINILSAMQYYSQTMISFVPNHWCFNNPPAEKVPFIEDLRLLQNNNYSCFPVDQLLIDHNNDVSSSRQLRHHDAAKPNNFTCSEWIYDHDYGYISMTSELNWICNDAWKSFLGQSMFFVGSVFGTLIFGILADKVGRLPILVIVYLISFLGNILTIFATDVDLFSLCRLIAGMATDSNFVLMYILGKVTHILRRNFLYLILCFIVMEYIRPSMRTFGLNICIGVFYCLGSMITPWIAASLGDWKLFLLAVAIPSLLVPTFYFLIPESAQWLISKQKIDEAIKSFQKIAKLNSKVLDPVTIEEFRENAKNIHKINDTENVNLLSLFKTPRLRKNTLILFFKSMVITLCYDAISKNVEGLGLSPFVMFTLSSATILPACLVLLALQDKIGRKAMASSSLFVSGIFTAATGIAIVYQQEKRDPVLLASLAMLGRFGVTVAYNSGAQYAAELIPTCVRAQGVSAAHVAGYALTFFSSYILYTGNFFLALPPLILGGLSIAGAFLCLLLPETLNRPTPVTLEDGENFGKDEPIFYFSCFEKPTESNTNLS
uniref:CSON003405 protein n=1 Tax=Culicoides sonorensis TaxID=179676 RepID=A0A336ML99_CULSO